MFLDMTIDPGVYSLLNVLLKVVIVSAIVAAPSLVLTLAMYLYERYKKWKNTEEKEKERIILGKAKYIVQQNEDLQRQHDEKKKLELELDLLNIRKKSIQDELNLSDEVIPEEDKEPEADIDLTKMNIKELKALAKERKIPMYSKLNKLQLLDKLKEVSIIAKAE